jgi:farnesyl-diphosphate farnesyltransferase
MIEQTLELAQKQVAFELTRDQVDYLNMHMNKVSRSFAVVVTSLEEPLRHFFSIAYLICRVADNIEDSEQPMAWQQTRFAELSRLLVEPSRAPDVLSGWDREQWPGLTSDEKLLMGERDGADLWQIYALLPDHTWSITRRWVSAMVEGMAHLEDPEHPPEWVVHNGVQLLSDEGDYDRYCYYVAGTVGHLATELVIDHYQFTDGVADSLLATCEACGRGLQKTNIVKDFAKDLDRGVCYLPDVWMREVDRSPLSLTGAPAEWKQKVLDNVMAELRDSVDYVLALPYSAVGYRIASLLCLLPAYQTILLAAQRHELLFTPGHHVKISRATLAQCLQDAQSMVANNDAVLRYSREIESAVFSAFNGLG